MYYLNPEVETLNRIFDQNMREPYLRLDLNENPGGLPEEFVKKVLSEKPFVCAWWIQKR